MNNLDYLLRIVENCSGVTQHNVHHPEGDVLNHSLQIFYKAYRESDDYDLVLAALLHDVGKQIQKLGHDRQSEKLIRCCVSEKTAWLVKNHMRVWTFILGEMKKHKKVKEIFHNSWFPDLVFLARWDKMSRSPNINIKFDKEDIKYKLQLLKKGK